MVKKRKKPTIAQVFKAFTEVMEEELEQRDD